MKQQDASVFGTVVGPYLYAVAFGFIHIVISFVLCAVD